jgi:hypothetical protein
LYGRMQKKEASGFALLSAINGQESKLSYVCTLALTPAILDARLR